MERAGPDGFDTGTRSQNATSSARDGAERTSSSPRSPDWIKDDGADFSSHFATEDLDRFPALKKRNFFCVQRHQATALHYDLRMQVDGGTVSWAIPKGLLGLNKADESAHIAVETTIHPIDYTVYEGSDGRIFSSGRRGGTLLWDIGLYTIDYMSDPADDSDSEEVKRRKRRRIQTESIGQHEEDKFRNRLYRHVGNKARTIHFTLYGEKLKQNSYILLLSPPSMRATTFSSNGQEKKNWLLKLPRHVNKYPWDRGGEDGDHYGRSIKTGRTFQEVLHSKPAKATSWQPDLRAFTGWKTITSTQETKQNPTSTSRQGATNDSGADDRERVVAGTQQEEGHDVEEIELQVPALIPDRTTLTRDGLSAQARGKRKR